MFVHVGETPAFLLTTSAAFGRFHLQHSCAAPEVWLAAAEGWKLEGKEIWEAELEIPQQLTVWQGASRSAGNFKHLPLNHLGKSCINHLFCTNKPD